MNRSSPLATLWIVGASLLLATGCSAARRASGAAANTPPASAAIASVPNLFDTQRQIAQYIDSGRYDAEFARVADDARAYLEERAGAVTRPAIVLDIDETSLSNWPAYRINGWARIVNGPSSAPDSPSANRRSRRSTNSRRPSFSAATVR